MLLGCADPSAEGEVSSAIRFRMVQGTVLLPSTSYLLEDGDDLVFFTTPATPGFYTWADLLPRKLSSVRMNEDVLVLTRKPTGHTCPAPSGDDATELLRTCIAATPPGTALELAPARYAVSRAIPIDRPITIRTRGVREDDARCERVPAGGTARCAAIVASPSFAASGGFLTSLAPNANLVLDHLVVDGNRAARLTTPSADQCRAGDNQYGVNADIRSCTSCFVTGSVFDDALCGTGLHVWNVHVVNSLFADNGTHTNDMLWADGLTAGFCHGTYTVNNDFIDNTDVGLIFGSGNDCVGRGNTIQHTGDPSKGSIVAMSIFTWFTTGPYFGSDFAYNDIDCNGQCGVGLGLGSDGAMGPHSTFIEGGSVHDNRVRAAHQGISVDTARNFEFYDNFVTESGGAHVTSCGLFRTNGYDMSALSTLDRSLDTSGAVFWTREWDWCTPNWFGTAPEPRFDVEDFDGDGAQDTLEIFPPDTGWYVSHGAQTWLEGWGAGHLHVAGDYDDNGFHDVLVYVAPGTWHVALSTGTGFAAYANALAGEPLSPDACSLDFDGDGDHDIVSAGRCASFDRTTHRFVASACTAVCDIPFDSSSFPATSSTLLYGSFARDPIADRRDALAIDHGALRWSVTRGRTPWLHHYEPWHEVLAGDYDGDGDGDVVMPKPGSWDLAKSDGERFAVHTGVLDWSGPLGFMCTRDQNGDGRTEIYWHGSPTNHRADYDLATGRFVVTPVTFACAIP
jgi:hypothetical protein